MYLPTNLDLTKLLEGIKLILNPYVFEVNRDMLENMSISGMTGEIKWLLKWMYKKFK